MGIGLTALRERLGALSVEAQRLRSKGLEQSDDLIRLVKILPRRAELEMQMAALGEPITPAQIQPKKPDAACPF